MAICSSTGGLQTGHGHTIRDRHVLNESSVLLPLLASYLNATHLPNDEIPSDSREAVFCDRELLGVSDTDLNTARRCGYEGHG